MISVWGVELDLNPVHYEMEWVVVWVVENDFISVRWVGINLVLCSGRKSLVFRVRIEIKRISVLGHRNQLDI